MVHAVPSAEQVPVPHTLFVHPDEQHSAGAAQGSPTFLHVGVAHLPLRHAPEQHEVPNSQIESGSKQDATHCPIWH